jgi:hypothetical protein
MLQKFFAQAVDVAKASPSKAFRMNGRFRRFGVITVVPVLSTTIVDTVQYNTILN